MPSWRCGAGGSWLRTITRRRGLWLDRLPVAVDTDSPRLAVTQITDFAMAHELTVYDAAYVELAVRRQIPLASRDQSLKRAAHRLGIPLLL